jgi:hypothetical protein
LRIFHSDLLADLFHEFCQEESFVQRDDWTLGQTLLETLTQMLSLVPEVNKNILLDLVIP